MIWDVIIIGAGAAGLFAAANIDDSRNVLMLEKSKQPGIKLCMTGGGQCNLTNAESIKQFLPKYNQGNGIRKILYQFNNQHLMQYFENRGISLAIREDGKVFPESMRATTIRDFLVKELKSRNHTLVTGEEVTGIRWCEELKTFTVKTDKNKYTSKKLIVATGGKSYPKTGSDGKMLEMIGEYGVLVKDFEPGLTPVRVEGFNYRNLAGIVLTSCQITIRNNHTKQINKSGELLFTHKDLSGPLILNNSRHMGVGTELEFDFVKHLKLEEVIVAIQRTIESHSKKSIKKVFELSLPIPNKLKEQILTKANFDKEKKASEVNHSTIHQLANLCKAYKTTVMDKSGFEKAMISTGGVKLSEVWTEDLSWKNNRQLYFIGEILDVDGETGGYNLQFAFSSAKKVASSLLFD